MEDFDPYYFRRLNARRRHERKMGSVDFSLPVDGDVAALRGRVDSAGDLMDGLVAELAKAMNPFQKEVEEKWNGLFPDLKAKPSRWVETPTGAGIGGKLFLSVNSAAALFAIRPKLKMIRERLSGLEHAPKKFTVHLEIRTEK